MYERLVVAIGVCLLAGAYSSSATTEPSSASTTSTQSIESTTTVDGSSAEASAKPEAYSGWSMAYRGPDGPGEYQGMEGIAAGGLGLVAVGYASGDGVLNAAVWTSPDGSEWTRLSRDNPVFGGDESTKMEDVTVGGPGLIAVGHEGTPEHPAVWTSVDGVDWTRVANDPGGLGPSGFQKMLGVAARDTGVVAVGWEWGSSGRHAAAWTSLDGIAWSRVPHDASVFGSGPDGFLAGHQMRGVTPGGPGFVAVGWVGDGVDLDAAVWTSPDGSTWTPAPHDEVVFGGASDQIMNDVAVGGPGLIAVGWTGDAVGESQAAVWTSTDGFTWIRVPNDTEEWGAVAEMHRVASSGSGIVAVGSDASEPAIWESPDGWAWSRVVQNADESGTLLNVYAGELGTVAVGWASPAYGTETAAVWVSRR